MKILYFLAHPNNIGGAAKVLLVQSKMMKICGHSVKMIIQNDEHGNYLFEYEKFCIENHIEYEVARYSNSTCIEEIDILSSIECYNSIYNIISDYKPDIVHSVQINVVVEMAARELKIPHLMNVYPVDKRTFSIKWLDILPRYHSCDSNYYRERWLYGPIKESECIRVAYETKKYSDRIKKKPNNRWEIINIGLFCEYKNQLQIIKFAEKCKNNNINVHVSFLGYDESSYGKVCRDYVLKNELRKTITFVGRTDNVEEYLMKSDVMIHASTTESYPGVIVEAMANRVFVIANPVGGIPELMENRKNGLLTRDSSVDSIYSSFCEYINLKENNKVEDIINNAFNTFIAEHSYQNVERKLENYYLSIINKYDNSFKYDYYQIKTIFENYIKNHIGNNILVDSFTKNHIWYLYHIEQYIKENKVVNAIIWGAGNYGKKAYEWCYFLHLSILGFIDSNKVGKYMGVPIYTPDIKIINCADIIFVAVSCFDSCEVIMNYLEKNHKQRNKDYFLVLNNPCLKIYND